MTSSQNIQQSKSNTTVTSNKQTNNSKHHEQLLHCVDHLPLSRKAPSSHASQPRDRTLSGARLPSHDPSFFHHGFHHLPTARGSASRCHSCHVAGRAVTVGSLAILVRVLHPVDHSSLSRQASRILGSLKWLHTEFRGDQIALYDLWYCCHYLNRIHRIALYLLLL